MNHSEIDQAVSAKAAAKDMLDHLSAYPAIMRSQQGPERCPLPSCPLQHQSANNSTGLQLHQRIIGAVLWHPLNRKRL